MKIQTALIAICAAVSAAPALAARESPYTPAAFHAAQAGGEAILVDVFAPWCPICRSQQATMKKLLVDKTYSGLHVFRIDYDSQKTDWQSLHVQRQGTLIAFKGAAEVDRVNFDTDPAAIRHALDAAVR